MRSQSIIRPTVIVRKKNPQHATTEVPAKSRKAPVPAQPFPRPAAAPIPTSSSRMTAPPRPARSTSSRAQAKPAAPRSETLPTQPNRRQRKAQAPRALLEVLRARWPAAFPYDPRRVRPLMRGVHRDIAQRLPGTGLWLIKRAIILFQAVSGGAYWRAVLKGGPRYALDGSSCGEVTPHEQEHAWQTLALGKKHPVARRRAAADGSTVQEEVVSPQ